MSDFAPGRRRGIETDDHANAIDPGWLPGNEDSSQPIIGRNPDRAHVPDLVQVMLSGLRSPASRRAYASDLKVFFGGTYTSGDVTAFVSQSTPAIAADLERYKGQLIGKGYTESTVNRRIAAVRSLLARAYRFGLSPTDGRGLVEPERIIPYRDTHGIKLGMQRRLLALPGTETIKGKRDTLALRIALENGLRVAELVGINIADLSVGDKRLRIRGKGRGSKAEWIEISAKVIAALKDYLQATGRWKATGRVQIPTGSGALLLSCDPRPEFAKARITTNGMYRVVMQYGAMLGIRLTPHMLRHSAITDVVRLSGGNLSEAQDFSRHKDANVLRRYNDNAGKAQGKLTRKRSREL